MTWRTLAAAALLAGCSSQMRAQSDREKELVARIEALEKRLAEVETRLGTAPPAPAQSASFAATPAPPAQPSGPSVDVNLMIDGYYGYSFNHPAGRVNLLRAYDVLGNSFSLNQAELMLERAPDPANGRRFGARLDLQFGQATEAQGGNPSNESRPQVFRNIFQAYGTYVAPLGRGLTVDFGKWASAHGIENNYTKDQMNYSRSLLFNFLPFYHFGFRTTYNFTGSFALSYWLVNGVGQSEDFNGSKSQNVEITVKPGKTSTWTANYYTGNENPDTVIRPAPKGRLHILDTYATWNATGKLTLAAEADYVVRRFAEQGAPLHVTGGAGYARYQFTGKFALAGRGEYLSDRGGLFSGVTQALKETTLTADYLLANGFLVRGEWRRDFSNRPFFLTDQPNFLKKEQNTATLGLIWWFGPHSGAW